MQKIIAVSLVALLATACTRTGGDYAQLSSGEYQIAGHPYKTAKDCERTAPVGKFDRRCDIPVVGFRNFSDPTIGVQSGGGGSFSVSGM